MKITTNHNRVNLVSYDELTEKQQKQTEKCKFDSYFVYKGDVYRISDFMYSNTFHQAWDAYFGTSYYSAIVLKIFPQENQVVVGRATW